MPIVPLAFAASLAVVAVASDPTVGTWANLGAAGLMGAMWLWERRQSRKRDEQLDAAHDRIMTDNRLMEKVMEALERNTRASDALAHAMESRPCLLHGEKK